MSVQDLQLRVESLKEEHQKAISHVEMLRSQVEKSMAHVHILVGHLNEATHQLQLAMEKESKPEESNGQELDSQSHPE